MQTAFYLYRQVLEDISKVSFFFGEIMKRFLKSIAPVEWVIWGASVASVTVSFFAFRNTQYLRVYPLEYDEEVAEAQKGGRRVTFVFISFVAP